jgi:hypothetical protein
LDWLDTIIANVVLNYIAGGMGVSEDEASRVVACVRRRHLRWGVAAPIREGSHAFAAKPLYHSRAVLGCTPRTTAKAA